MKFEYEESLPQEHSGIFVGSEVMSALGGVAAGASGSELIDSGIPEISPELQAEMEVVVNEMHNTLNDTQELMKDLDITVPGLLDFMEKGLDLEALAKAHMDMTKRNLLPDIVVSPNMRVDQWEVMYNNLADKIGHHSSLLDVDISNTLIKRSFSSVPNGTAKVVTVFESLGEANQWMVRIIQGSTNVRQGVVTRQEHTYPTISEYLMMQALRIARNKGQLDVVGSTLLNCRRSTWVLYCGSWSRDDTRVHIGPDATVVTGATRKVFNETGKKYEI